MAVTHYGSKPQLFLKHLNKMRMDTVTGIDLVGERSPVIYKPGGKYWGPTTLPWMAFGYNLSISPLQTAMLYNAIANNGVMLKPYLVSSVKEEGILLKEFLPKVLDPKICSDATLAQLKSCLEGVCIEGTARELFKTAPYKVAGKTGTALVADGNKGYASKIYQSSFAGYFPAENPQYTCIVVIKNKPFAPVFYGASVAGPVFREIADRLYSTYTRGIKSTIAANKKSDSISYQYAGYKSDITYLSNQLKLKYQDSTGRADQWSSIQNTNATLVLQRKPIDDKSMPILKGMGLKDALFLCEEMGLSVSVKGKGKVEEQSIMPGQFIVKGQQIVLSLN
jgi:cell division protein FtsI (penicillin-binding protein 3)